MLLARKRIPFSYTRKKMEVGGGKFIYLHYANILNLNTLHAKSGGNFFQFKRNDLFRVQRTDIFLHSAEQNS